MNEQLRATWFPPCSPLDFEVDSYPIKQEKDEIENKSTTQKKGNTKVATCVQSKSNRNRSKSSNGLVPLLFLSFSLSLSNTVAFFQGKDDDEADNVILKSVEEKRNSQHNEKNP